MNGKSSRPSSIKVEIHLVCSCDCWEGEALWLSASVSANHHLVESVCCQGAGSYHGEHEVRECGGVISSDSGDDAASFLVSCYLDDLADILFAAEISKPACLS